jgi:hypothetical protein
MRKLMKIAMLGLGLTGAALVAGCESDYYDRDTGHNGYYRNHDSDDYDRDHRHWVCDSDGDNCHWDR